MIRIKNTKVKMVSTSISFHFDITEPITKKLPNLNGYYYEAVVQIEWDCIDAAVNSIIENDMNTKTHTKNLSWIYMVKFLVSSELKLDQKTPLYISFYKVMDGILNCYVTIYPNQSVVYDVIVNENDQIGFLKV